MNPPPQTGNLDIPWRNVPHHMMGKRLGCHTFTVLLQWNALLRRATENAILQMRNGAAKAKVTERERERRRVVA